MEKQRWEELVKRRAEQKREDQRRERVRRKKMQVCEKVGKSRLTDFFRWFVSPEGRKVGSLKRRVRSHLAKWEMKSCTALWCYAHLSTSGGWDVEKVHAVVARSTFRSQNVQSTPFSERFWKLKCQKSARPCGAKHISKSKCTKHTGLMSEKCMPLWREAHFHVKMLKNTTCLDHLWKFRCRFVQSTRFHWLWASMTLRVEQCSPCCVSVGPNLARSCCQRFQVARFWTWPGPPCASHSFKGASIPIRFGPNFSPAWPVGSSLGSSWLQAKMDRVGGQLGPKLGPTRANFADSVRHAESLHFYL